MKHPSYVEYCAYDPTWDVIDVDYSRVRQRQPAVVLGERGCGGETAAVRNGSGKRCQGELLTIAFDIGVSIFDSQMFSQF